MRNYFIDGQYNPSMINEKAIQAAQETYGKLLREQLERVERLKPEGDWVDYSKLDKLIIGVCGGDGIGPDRKSVV